MRVRDALAFGRALGIDRLDAQLLVANRLGCDRTWVLAHDDAELPDGLPATLEDDLRRRADGVPLAYLTGRRGFHRLELDVGPAVLVPRPETELLVDWAAELLRPLCGRDAHPQVVDLGTGSGAIALALASEFPSADITATDISADALEVARENVRQHELRVQTVCGSWWDAVPGWRFDLAVSNPPYIAAGDPHLEALRHEPPIALTPGGDGLDALRTIVAGAGHHVKRAGWLLLEHGHDQAAEVTRLLRDAGFEDVVTRHDLAGHPRCSGGRWSGGAAASREPDACV